MKLVERAFSRIMYGKPDYSIKKGDVVTSKNWSGTLTVVDVNWALRAAAVELAPGSIVVWPVGGLKKAIDDSYGVKQRPPGPQEPPRPPNHHPVA